MTWTATVENKQIDKRGNLVVTVLFDDGSNDRHANHASHPSTFPREAA